MKFTDDSKYNNAILTIQNELFSDKALRETSAIEHNNQGDKAFKKGEFTSAWISFVRAVSLDKDNAIYKKNLGITCVHFAHKALADLRFETAITFFVKAVEHDSSLKSQYPNLATAYDRLGGQSLHLATDGMPAYAKQALDLFLKAVECHKSGIYMRNAALAYNAGKDWDTIGLIPRIAGLVGDGDKSGCLNYILISMIALNQSQEAEMMRKLALQKTFKITRSYEFKLTIQHIKIINDILKQSSSIVYLSFGKLCIFDKEMSDYVADNLQHWKSVLYFDAPWGFTMPEQKLKEYNSDIGISDGDYTYNLNKIISMIAFKQSQATDVMRKLALQKTLEITGNHEFELTIQHIKIINDILKQSSSILYLSFGKLCRFDQEVSDYVADNLQHWKSVLYFDAPWGFTMPEQKLKECNPYMGISDVNYTYNLDRIEALMKDISANKGLEILIKHDSKDLILGYMNKFGIRFTKDSDKENDAAEEYIKALFFESAVAHLYLNFTHSPHGVQLPLYAIELIVQCLTVDNLHIMAKGFSSL